MFCLISTSVDNVDVAKNISHKIISSNLAFCVNISSPLISTYYWNNKVEESIEYKIEIKSVDKNKSRICKIIKQFHSYEIPEIISNDIIIESNDYRDWANNILRKG